jgi:RNA polymerase sigma-B factor
MNSESDSGACVQRLNGQHCGAAAPTPTTTLPAHNALPSKPDLLRELGELNRCSPEFRYKVDQIVQQYLPLADHIARRYSYRGESRDDLVQAARLGLLNAVNRFNAELGSDFVSFAVPTIMGEIRRHFRDYSWSIKVPRRLKELNVRLGSATPDLAQRLGRMPTASELANELDVDRAQITQAQAAGLSYNALSIDGGTDGEDTPRLINSLGAIDCGLKQIEDREVLRPLLQTLSDRERTVLQLRFFESCTQTEIAQRVGISQMHVSRLLKKSLTHMRDQLQTQ